MGRPPVHENIIIAIIIMFSYMCTLRFVPLRPGLGEYAWKWDMLSGRAGKLFELFPPPLVHQRLLIVFFSSVYYYAKRKSIRNNDFAFPD